MKNVAAKMFQFRSYTPIPFLLIMLIFQEASIVSLIAGGGIALIGEWLRLWGVCYAGSETRTTGEVGGTYLVISGPFAFVKNPLYLGNITMYMGIGIMSMALFPYLQIAALLFFYFQYYLIISEEEKYLADKFGDDYKDYYKNVPKLIPKLIPYKNNKIPQPGFDFMAGLRSEGRTLQALFSVSILLIIVWIFELNKALVL
jgi:protein-S-isoprenylcysteine O-methyltransferase Ste14